MSQTPDEISPAMRELGEMIQSGEWHVMDGLPDLVVIHPYDDDSVDTIAVKDEDDVAVQRTNPLGFSVWEHKKLTLADGLAKLRELPAPGEPGAPALKLPTSRRPIDSDL